MGQRHTNFYVTRIGRSCSSNGLSDEHDKCIRWLPGKIAVMTMSHQTKYSLRLNWAIAIGQDRIGLLHWWMNPQITLWMFLINTDSETESLCLNIVVCVPISCKCLCSEIKIWLHHPTVNMLFLVCTIAWRDGVISGPPWHHEQLTEMKCWKCLENDNRPTSSPWAGPTNLSVC